MAAGDGYDPRGAAGPEPSANEIRKAARLNWTPVKPASPQANLKVLGHHRRPCPKAMVFMFVYQYHRVWCRFMSLKALFSAGLVVNNCRWRQ